MSNDPIVDTSTSALTGNAPCYAKQHRFAASASSQHPSCLAEDFSKTRYLAVLTPPSGVRTARRRLPEFPVTSPWGLCVFVGIGSHPADELCLTDHRSCFRLGKSSHPRAARTAEVVRLYAKEALRIARY